MTTTGAVAEKADALELQVDGLDPDGVTRPARRRSALGVGPTLGLVMLVLVVGYSLIYPLLPWYDAYGQDLTSILLAPGDDPAHVLGTDNLGRDTASRLAVAGRLTIAVVGIILLSNIVIGTVIGMLAGYVGGRIDNMLMGLADIQLALPVILILTALAATFGPSLKLMVIVLSVTYWVGYARVARTVTRSIRDRDFVLAPRLQGASWFRILRVHIVPAVLVQMLILASTDIGAVILLMSSFDYLGLGVQPPTPSWGSMIGDSQMYLRQSPSQAIVPGIAILLTVAGTNLLSQRFTAEGRRGARPTRRSRAGGAR